eukprot:GILK01000602.1.p1 GENE.GILK01000602.1~~GILK01000602.1.p1  ORF type:complete len:437 (+),score=52.86 GILK01000602.1:88-1398(+)
MSFLGRLFGSSNQSSHDDPNIPAAIITSETPVEAPALGDENRPATNETSTKELGASLDLVFCVDCTGSMGSYIASAQENIRSIVEKLIAFEKCDVQFALVCYRDHPPQDSSYVTQVFNFTKSLSKMQEYVDSMSANGGGDGPEAVADGLHAVLHMPWRKAATKISILISDAPPHGLGENGDGFPDGCPLGHDPIAIAHEMLAAGITVYTVGCEGALGSYQFARDFLISIAEITQGQAITLASAGLLSDVILGGAREEMALEKLMHDVQREIEQVRHETPAISEEEVTDRVQSMFAARNIKSKQMIHDNVVDAPWKEHIKKGKNMSEVRAALSAAAPSSSVHRASGGIPGPGLAPSYRAPSASLRSASHDAECESMCSMEAPSMASMAPAPRMEMPVSKAASHVECVERDVSYEQVSRMVKKSAARSKISFSSKSSS